MPNFSSIGQEMAEILRIQRTCGGGGGWVPSKNLVTSDRLVIRESVGLGQRGSDKIRQPPKVTQYTDDSLKNSSSGLQKEYFNGLVQ